MREENITDNSLENKPGKYIEAMFQIIETIKEHKYRKAVKICNKVIDQYLEEEAEEKILVIKHLSQENNNCSKGLKRTIQYIALEREKIIDAGKAKDELTELWRTQVKDVDINQLLLSLIICSVSKHFSKLAIQIVEECREKLSEMDMEHVLEFGGVIYKNICMTKNKPKREIKKQYLIKEELDRAKTIDPLFPRSKEQNMKTNGYIIDRILENSRSVIMDNEEMKAVESECIWTKKINAKKNFYSNYTFNKIELDKCEEKEKLISSIRKEFDIRVMFISYPKSGRTWLRSILEGCTKMWKRDDYVFTHLMANPAFWSVSRKDFACPEYKDDITVFIHRDPRDVIVSQFHQINKRDLPHMESNKKKYGHMLSDKITEELIPPKEIDKFILDEHWGIKRVMDFNKSVLATCNIDHIWNYEEMIINPYATMSKLVKTIELKITIEKLLSSIEANEFNKMKNKELKENREGRLGKLYKGHNLGDRDARKVRKGIIGGWKEEVNKEHHEEINRLTFAYYESMDEEQRKRIYIPKEFS